MKRIAIDTNVAIAFLNNQEGIKNSLRGYDEIYLPITVCGELIFGAKNSAHPIKNIDRLGGLLEYGIILNSNLQVAETYGGVRKQLKEIGRPIPENDIWIAAICLANELPLMTFDKHFSYVEGLSVKSLSS